MTDDSLVLEYFGPDGTQTVLEFGPEGQRRVIVPLACVGDRTPFSRGRVNISEVIDDEGVRESGLCSIRCRSIAEIRLDDGLTLTEILDELPAIHRAVMEVIGARE